MEDNTLQSFRKYLLRYIDFTDNQSELSASLKLVDFVGKKIGFDDFLQTVFDYTEKLVDSGSRWLNDATKRLMKRKLQLTEDSLEKLCKNISNSIAKATIKLLENGLTLEIYGNNFFLSESKKIIEDGYGFKDGKIKEVRIVARSVLHVDCNFEKNLWHGVSVFVWTNVLHVVKSDTTWDVSGLDNSHKYEGNAGTDSNGDGIDGKDGYAGESGGNVLVKASTVKNGKYLTIISNGGRGSVGQDGGSGKDGVDGVSVTTSELNAVPNATDPERSRGDSDFSKARRHIESNAINPHAITYNRKEYERWGDGYIEASLKTGKSITYICHNLVQTLWLIKGSEGAKGGKGGYMGRSGEDGFPGSIQIDVPTVHHIILKSQNANSDAHALGGYKGKNGLSGADMGKLSWIEPKSTGKRWFEGIFTLGISEIINSAKHNIPGTVEIKIYGTSGKEYLTLSSSSSDDTDRVYSSYSRSYMGIVSSGTVEHHSSSAERKRNNSKQQRELQHQAHASKQIALNETELVQLYKDNFSDQVQLEALEAIKAKDETEELIEEKQELEIQVNVTVEASEKMPPNIKDKIIEASDVDTIKNEIVQKLTPDMELSKEKYVAFETLATVKLKDTVVPTSPDTSKGKYLTYDKHKKVENFELMDALNKPISERENYLKKLEKSPIKTFDDLQSNVLKTFIYEAYEIKGYKSLVEGCYDAHEKFVKDTTKDTLLKLTGFESSLVDYPKLKAAFAETLHEPVTQKVFEQELQETKDQNLIKAYTDIKKLRNKNFDWKSCCNDKDPKKADSLKNELLKALVDHLKVCKRDCPTFMEFMAQLFNRKICYYRKSLTTSGFELRSTFNASYDTTTHLFKTDNNLYELSFNDSLFQLHHRRKVAEQKYVQMLIDVELFRTKDEIQKYLKEKLYEKDNGTIDDCDINSNFYNYVVDDDISFLLNLCENYTNQSEELRQKFDIVKKLQAASTIHYLADRLRLVQGETNITIRDIHLILNTVIAYARNSDKFILINWVLVSQKPQHWTHHITILRLEYYLELEIPPGTKIQWISFLQKIDRNIVNLICLKIVRTDRHTLDLERLQNILFLLCVAKPKVTDVVNLDLHEWAFVLKEFYWKEMLRETIGWATEDDIFQKSIDLLLKIETLTKFSTTMTLINAFGEKKNSLKEESDRKIMVNILQNIADEAWYISDESLKVIKEKETKDWEKEIQKIFPVLDHDRTVKELVKIMTSKVKVEQSELLSAQNTILSNISTYADSVEKINQITTDAINKKMTKVQLQEWAKNFLAKTLTEKLLLIEEMIGLINRGITLWSYKDKSDQGFRIRDTQLLSAVIILKHNRNTLLQVATGEGKSLIIAVVAIVRILFGESVDVITTSSVLAKRDAEELKELYAMFNVTVGHNTDPQTSKRQISYKNSHVIYGDLPSFQRDYLLDKFYGKNVMSGRRRENVIVDEVDNMLLDHGNNTLYLSHEIPELDKLELIYLHIWTRVIMGKTSAGGKNLVWDTNVVAKEVEIALYGLIDVEDVKTVFNNLDPSKTTKLMEILTKYKLIDKNQIVTSKKIDNGEALKKELAEIDKYIYQFMLKLIENRFDRILTKNELKKLEGFDKQLVEKVYQIMKDEKIIDLDGQILLEKMNADLIKSNLSTYTGIEDVLEPIITMLDKLMKRQIDDQDIFEVRVETLEHQSRRILDLLKLEGVIDDFGHIKKKKFDYEDVEKSLNAYSEIKEILKPLLYLIQQRIEREIFISAPNYLKPFIMKNLETWIDNAKLALLLRDQDDYVIDVDRVSGDGSTVVTILDKDTGTDLATSQWDSGLHQFIQLKHGCRVTPQSLKAVFISNVSYFKQYEHLTGLSGTLGSDIELQHLVDAHEVDFLALPTFKQRQFRELSPFVMPTVDAWITKVYHETLTMLTKERRAVLIICETVKFAEDLSQHFDAHKKEGMFEIRTYTRDYEIIDIIHGKQKLEPGFIIIATNLAGRGTDIKLSEELIKNGGLHVIITFLSANDRIEQQAMGRCARKGEPGSGQIIVYSDEFKTVETNNNYKLLKLRSQRRLKEADHITSVRKYYTDQIQVEEDCFNLFKDVWSANVDRIQRSGDAHHNETLKRGILDKWAFWLDNNISHSHKMNKSLVMEKCSKFLKDIEDLSLDRDNLHLWVDDLAGAVLLGLSMIKSDDAKSAIKYFNSVIDKEPHFCEAAHYYKALALTKNKSDIEEIQSSLKNALNLFELRKNNCSIAKALISNLKSRTATITTQSRTFEEQQENLQSIYDVFIKSIYDLCGYYMDKEILTEMGKCEKYEAIIVQERLGKDTLILDDYKLKPELMDVPFRNYCESLSVSFESLRDFVTDYGSLEDLKQFRDEMSKIIEAPNREEFWEDLKVQGILKDVQELYLLSRGKLEEVEPSLHAELFKKKYFGFMEKSNIYLHPEIVADTEDYFMIKKLDFHKLVSSDTKPQPGDINYLLTHECIVENKCGVIDATKLIDIEFEEFSTVPADVLKSQFISKDQSKVYLDLMVDIDVLEFDPVKKVYKPKLRFFSFDFNHPDIPEVYREWINRQLSKHFAYKIAYFNLCSKLISNDIDPEKLTRKATGDDSITLEQSQYVLDALVKQKILAKTCLGGYLLIGDPSDIKFDQINISSNMKSITSNSFTWIQKKLIAAAIQQKTHFEQHHTSSVKIELMSQATNAILGQMITQGIIEQKKIKSTDECPRDNLDDCVMNHLSSNIKEEDLMQIPSAQKCAEEIINKLKEKKVLIEVHPGEYRIVSKPSTSDIKTVKCDNLKTILMYLDVYYDISQQDFVNKITDMILNGRGTLQKFKGKFEMVQHLTSKCTSLKAKVEQRQFITNSLEHILIGQEKIEKPSFWGWIVDLVVSIVIIVVAIVLSVIGLPILGAPLLLVGTVVFLTFIIGPAASLSEVIDKTRQVERSNAEKVSTFLAQIQQQINVSYDKLTEEQEMEVTRVIKADIQRANFVKLTLQYQATVQEELNAFEKEIYKILEGEVSIAYSIAAVNASLLAIYNKAGADEALDELEEFHLDMVRITDIIADPFKTFRTDITGKLVDAAKIITILDLSTNFKFKSSIHTKFTETMNYYENNHTSLFEVIKKDYFAPYVQDIKDKQCFITGTSKLLRSERDENMIKRESVIKNALKDGIRFELKNAIKEILLEVKTAYMEKINQLVDTKLAEMNAHDEEMVGMTEDELKQSQGIVIHNLSLIKTEYNYLKASPILMQRFKSLNLASSSPITEQSFKDLQEDCVKVMTTNRLKGLVNKNMSYFSELHQSANVTSFLDDIVTDLVQNNISKDSIKQQKQLFLDKLNMAMLIFSEQDASYHNILQHIFNVIQFGNIPETMTCHKNIFKLLIVSTIFNAESQAGNDSPSDESNGTLSFTFVENELIISSSKPKVAWQDFQYCVRQSMKLLQEESRSNVTKVTILRVISDTAASSGAIILAHLDYLLTPTDSVTIYHSDGSIISKKLKDFPVDDELQVDPDPSFDFNLIELLQVFASVFPNIVQISKYCKSHWKTVNNEMTLKKVKMGESRNIFNQYIFKVPEDEKKKNAKK